MSGNYPPLLIPPLEYACRELIMKEINVPVKKMNQELLDALADITPEEQRLLTGNPVDMANYASGKVFVIDSAKMLEKGKLIAIRPHTRFADFPRHMHNYIEIMYMCSGSTTHIINDTATITLLAGELLFLNQHACHAIQKAGADDIAINFIVLPQFFDVAFSMIGSDNLLRNFLISSLRQDSDEISYLHFQVADILPVQNLMENLVWSIVNHQPNNRLINQTTMGLLFTILLNHTERLAVPVAQRYDNALVLGALKEIEENYKTANLSDLAASRGISLAYLSRLVKSTTGCTYTALLQNKRLSKASQLLRETRLPVQDIIEAVGYDNTSYFYRIFKEKFNTNPKAYRDS